MPVRIRPSYLVLFAFLICGLSIAGMIWWRSAQNSTVADLLERLPEEESVKLFIDVAALRSSGLLDLIAGTPAEEEPSYKEFAREIDFDYRSDLDQLVVSFSDQGSRILARGRFHWGQLFRYTEARGGVCQNGFCQTFGSTENRRISFFAASPTVLALSSSADRWSAVLMYDRREEIDPATLPQEPLWLMASGRALNQLKWLPVGTQSFASALSTAGNVVLSLGPAGTDFEAALRVDCASPEHAARLSGDLIRVTELLRSLIRREDKTPSNNDLSGILTAGQFAVEGTRVTGTWPVSWDFVRAVTAGD